MRGGVKHYKYWCKWINGDSVLRRARMGMAQESVSVGALWENRAKQAREWLNEMANLTMTYGSLISLFTRILLASMRTRS